MDTLVLLLVELIEVEVLWDVDDDVLEALVEVELLVELILVEVETEVLLLVEDWLVLELVDVVVAPEDAFISSIRSRMVRLYTYTSFNTAISSAETRDPFQMFGQD